MTESVTELATLGDRVVEEVGRVVVGMESEIRAGLVAVLAGGHALLEGPPGVAKTLLVRALATTLGGSFGRVQFTPDLMPADVTGTSIFRPGDGQFEFRPGPLFAHVLLCDEINRAPAKTQAALLEAMQEASVTVDGTTHELPVPFTVFATQNPVEHEGTYPLPEAQLDRFLIKILVGYPDADTEERLLERTHSRSPLAGPAELGVQVVTGPEGLAAARATVLNVQVRPELVQYIVRVLGVTRSTSALSLGASPRAGVAWTRAAKALAALAGRDFVTPDDVKATCLPALRHRVFVDPGDELLGTTADDVLGRILEVEEVPR